MKFSYVLIGVVVMVVVGAITYWISTSQTCRNFKEGTVTIGTRQFSVSIADDTAEQVRGLGGCSFIPEESGMYFVYNQPSQVAFWMKGMVIPIDIIWIASGQVVGIEEYVPVPADQKTDLLPQYQPDQPVDAVLEIEAGGAERYGITVGAPVQTNLR